MIWCFEIDFQINAALVIVEGTAENREITGTSKFGLMT
jgi:hypothetical protein